MKNIGNSGEKKYRVGYKCQRKREIRIQNKKCKNMPSLDNTEKKPQNKDSNN